jgi:hypothetical protein
MHSDDKPMREIDDTSSSAAEDRFDEILKKVEAAGAEITLDEESPLYMSIGVDDYEIGRQRIVEFSLNGMDFHIARQEKTARLVGGGQHKSIEELPRPHIDIKLKRKPGISNEWVFVDLEDVF